MQYLLTVIDSRVKCYQMASFTSRILVLFLLTPELKEIVVFDNKRKKVLRRIDARLFIQPYKEHTSNAPFFKMFRFSQSTVPHFMTFSKGHLDLKFYCLIKLRKIIDMSLTNLYQQTNMRNLSSTA